MTLHPAAWLTSARASLAVTACLLGLGTVPAARAGGSAEDALLIVDPSVPESLYVANVYLARRDIPRENVLFMTPGAASYQAFATSTRVGFLGALEQRGLQHVDYVIVPPGGSFFVPASGLVSDGCVAVNRFSIVTGYMLAHQADAILSGIGSLSLNQYSRQSWGARGFESETAWLQGNPSRERFAERYFIGAMLGYTGANGNTLQEVLDLIERSASADFTQPAGSVYYVETTDQARSGPRHDLYPTAVAQMASAGGSGQHIFGVLPTNQHDCMGVMTGWASPDIDGEPMTLLPGSFADHLTSFAGNFSTSSQTKMSRWIARGASGTAGTVEEPCNYAAKFPHPRLHVVYRKGLSLGEAWLRSSAAKPFQPLFYGDPLTRPYTLAPTVDLPGLPGAPAAGSLLLTPAASATAPGADIEELQLFVDGEQLASVADGASFQLDTTRLADGWHELRVVAIDDKLARNKGSFVGQLDVSNHGHSVALLASSTSGDLATAFDFVPGAVAGNGAAVTGVQLLQHGRVLASTPLADGTLRLWGQNLGAGPVRVVAEASYSDGTRARSQPLALTIDFAGNLPVGALPIAYDSRRQIDPAHAALIELPAAHGEDFATVGYALLQAPAQASVLLHAGAPYVIIQPAAGASGSDTLQFRVDALAGSSNVATVTLEYTPACPPPASECQSSANSVGAGMLMSHAGSAGVGANDLELVAAPGPAGQPGIFYYGPGAVQQPFGDGVRCVGGGSTFRLPPLAIDAGGEARFALDVTQPPSPAGQISAGDTWRFQFWYRDPAALGAGFNLSDGLRIEFCP